MYAPTASSAGDTYLVEFIQNELPTNLIYIPEMKLMGKSDMYDVACREIVRRAKASLSPYSDLGNRLSGGGTITVGKEPSVVEEPLARPVGVSIRTELIPQSLISSNRLLP